MEPAEADTLLSNRDGFLDWKIHPVAGEFPLLEGDEFVALVADIKQNGLREPILLDHTGRTTTQPPAAGGPPTLGDHAAPFRRGFPPPLTLIDGRNRERACRLAGVEPPYKRLMPMSEMDILCRIVSRNLVRRHLNPGQLAVLALRIEEALADARTRGRPKKEPATGKTEVPVPPIPETGARARQSRETAAMMVGIGATSISHAKKVASQAPELLADIRIGKRSLADAYKEVQSQAKMQAANYSDDGEPVSKSTKRIIILKTLGGGEVPYPAPQRPVFNKTNDQVSWARFSWGPVTGCLHNCPSCYAREMAYRHA